ncbi:hypothetical protein [Psychrobacter sp. JCM 18900]|nr:hypothetical protein [Psychrobacter sp. JCM 18900]
MTTLLSNEPVSQPVLFIPHGAGPCFLWIGNQQIHGMRWQRF